MIRSIRICETECTVPYRNLALEKRLMDTVPDGTCILYLWQNQNTVVIGQNQNAWKECHVRKLEADGGQLVRRLSGGGAVFHDLGNLNFTFLVKKADYDVDRQLEVILRAVSALGVPAEKSGRNDITAQGRKFSGNAFYFHGDSAYHHGTLLIAADTAKAAEYLNVSAEKIRSKGVDSVRSRIGNLTEFCPGLTVGRMKRELSRAFGEVYGCTPEVLPASAMDGPELEDLSRKFASADWIYGRNVPFQYEFSRRFPWGEVTVCLNVKSGRIADAQVYSDAMDEAFILQIPELLRDCLFSSAEAAKRLHTTFASDPERASLSENIEHLLIEQNF